MSNIQRLILIGKSNQIEARLDQVAHSFGAALETYSEPSDGIASWKSAMPDYIFIAVKSLAEFKSIENQIEKSLGLYSDQVDRNKIAIFTEKVSDFPEILQSPIVGARIPVESLDQDQSVKILSAVIRISCAGVNGDFSNALYGCDNILSNKIHHSSGKALLIDETRRFLLENQFKSRITSLIINAVDELIMNAIFDAPVDELGKQVHSTLPRNSKLELLGKNSVLVKMGFKDNLFGISVIDQHGSLSQKELIKHIGMRYRTQDYTVQETRASAGLGLSTVFELGANLFFISEQQVRTEVIALFQNYSNYGKFKNQFKIFAPFFYF